MNLNLNNLVPLLFAFGFALLIWLIVYFLDQRISISKFSIFGLLIVIGAIFRIVFATQTPTFYAPDEEPHYKYVEYLGKNHAFPIQTHPLGSPTNDWEYYQPPAYYLILSSLYLIPQAELFDPSIFILLIRGFSIILWGINVFFLFKLLENLNITDAVTQIFMVGMITLLPTYLFLSSVINNDNLIITIAGGFFYLITRKKQKIWDSILIGVLLGLGLLTKFTGIILVGFYILFALLSYFRSRDPRALASLILSTTITFLIWLPWGWRNIMIYGSLTAETIANLAVEWSSLGNALLFTVKNMIDSFWAVAGISNNVRFLFPLIGRVIGLALGAGFLYGILLRRERIFPLINSNIPWLAASLVAILVQFLLILRFGILYGQAQGRFFFPLLFPISIILAIGLRSFPISKIRSLNIHLVGFFITYSMTFLMFSLTIFKTIGH